MRKRTIVCVAFYFSAHFVLARARFRHQTAMNCIALRIRIIIAKADSSPVE